MYHAEEPKNSELIDATVVYRKSGKLPVTVGDSLPSLVATQTIEDRYYSRPVVSERASHLAGGYPVVRQQLGQGAGLLRRQAREHVLQVGVRIVPVQAG